MRIHIMSALALAAAVAACGGGNKGTDSTTTAGTTTTATTTSGSTASAAGATAPGGGQMNDANVVAFLDWANEADSAGGKMASEKGTNASVKDFGRQMMRDHHQLRQQGQDLAKKANITPQPMANDTLRASHQRAADSLQSMPKGAAWDRAYIDHEVAMHQAVLSTAQNALNSVQNADLKALIQKAAPAIQGHLDKAKSIQGKLGGGTTASTGTGSDSAKKGAKR